MHHWVAAGALVAALAFPALVGAQAYFDYHQGDGGYLWRMEDAYPPPRYRLPYGPPTYVAPRGYYGTTPGRSYPGMPRSGYYPRYYDSPYYRFDRGYDWRDDHRPRQRMGPRRDGDHDRHDGRRHWDDGRGNWNDGRNR